ncbi:energy-coupling factor transporter ATPase [Hathewaya histolytica]|uniref:Energy-coupling factor transporter ATP-binding protein EcfA2 n=1 Tax=Hathewaya histolytica TaxID=1498 RepID=A0A4V6Z1F6_HATHI|nr:energy-coupling factor transporter ATPase [Hathewaya histolytica]VTQ94927.1 cobalt transporter ATP-binding subunit [Hathewaya histolytica]
MFIEVKDLSYIYMQGTPFEKKALDNVSLGIDEGDFVAIIGHTGSGKSTLIQMLNGLLKPSLGTVYLNNVDIFDKKSNLADIRKEVGIVFQYPEYQLFEETIEKDIAYGPTNLGIDIEEIRERVKLSMNMVGLNYQVYKDKSPFNLSGGQKRRVAIAGILAMKPKVLILDEPTAGLDPKGRNDILNTIRDLNQKYNITIILVSHSMDDVSKFANSIIVMSEGKCVLKGTKEEIFKEVDLLQKIGLTVPTVTSLINELNKKGFNIKDNIYTVDELKEELVGILDLKVRRDKK